jgi:anaerobic magnesium-protoporphyrin IX monomethyl ester cyclase
MINELLPHSIGVSVSYPLPGTRFYEKVKNELEKKANWTDSDELKLMFKNTYQPAFYKQLHRYVQRNHRMHMSVDYVKRSFRQMSLSPFLLKKLLSIFYYLPGIFIAKLKLSALEK